MRRSNVSTLHPLFTARRSVYSNAKCEKDCGRRLPAISNTLSVAEIREVLTSFFLLRCSSPWLKEFIRKDSL
jgi:hypothetical protein